VVLDLRGNSGGLIPSLTAVSGLFVEKPTSLGTMTLGDGQSLQLMALPRQVSDDGREIRRHTGKLAILTDRGSVSCSDIFPAGLQAVGRARIFGSPSAGMALPAVAVPLPSGDRLLYPTADFVDPLKRRIEGVGVVPDQSVVPTPASLAQGGDPVLDAAVAWLGGST
jgi:carboxyl-terminal processing protease